MFIASHFENQISVVWFGYNGIASIQIIISPPPTFDTGVPVSIEAAVRAVTTLAIPQPWEFDIPNRIINEWYSLHMSPARIPGTPVFLFQRRVCSNLLLHGT